jgi:FemAB-related protein (PEP-CTERM system-associated)
MRIATLTPEREAGWDAFVSGCAQATFFHRAGWKAIIEGLGHNAHFLYAEADGRIEGVLPLGHMQSRLFGNALVSAPFCVYGGIAARNDDAYGALDQAAAALARRLDVDYLELRNCTPSQTGRPVKDLYVSFRKEIDSDPEKNMLAIPRKQRAMVRKGINARLVSEIDDDIGRFYDAYADSVRRLGTPVFARKFFLKLLEIFGKDCEILTITRAEETIASVMSFYFRDEVLPYYGGGTSAAREVAGNDFMYWELMRRACQRGVKWFDYGRSKRGTGSYSFKKNWGFDPKPLYYEYELVNAKAMPDINPLNPKYRMLIETWKRLPLALTKLIGPMVSRHLG